MKWGDSKRDLHPILAVWPSYEPLSGAWQIQELAETEPGIVKWRDRRIPGPTGGVRLDRYTDEMAAQAAAKVANAGCALELDRRPLDEAMRISLRLKADKALQAKERLKSEEALMLAEARRRKQGTPAPLAQDLKLSKEAEPFRELLAEALSEFPYVTGIRIGEIHDGRAMSKNYDGTWLLLANGRLSKRMAVLIERAKIASGFDLNPTDHWGEVKANIRQMLLPRANQLLQLASVRRLLDEALARGQKVLVGSGVVFWYEDDGQLGWQVKTTDSQSESGPALWTQGTIVSTNHGRLVILPFIKENGEKVKGHTKNAPKDGPAKPRHPSQYVEIPFQMLDGDLMIGLFGELPYE